MVMANVNTMYKNTGYKLQTLFENLHIKGLGAKGSFLQFDAN